MVEYPLNIFDREKEMSAYLHKVIWTLGYYVNSNGDVPACLHFDAFMADCGLDKGLADRINDHFERSEH